MIGFVHKIIKKIFDALRGFVFAFTNDLSFKIDVFVGVGLFLFGYLMRPLSELEFVLLVLSWSLIIITELQNTSIETALDRIHPERHDEIGMSKDIAAASVLTSYFFAAFIVAVIVIERI